MHTTHYRTRSKQSIAIKSIMSDTTNSFTNVGLRLAGVTHEAHAPSRAKIQRFLMDQYADTLTKKKTLTDRIQTIENKESIKESVDALETMYTLVTHQLRFSNTFSFLGKFLDLMSLSINYGCTNVEAKTINTSKFFIQFDTSMDQACELIKLMLVRETEIFINTRGQKCTDLVNQVAYYTAFVPFIAKRKICVDELNALLDRASKSVAHVLQMIERGQYKPLPEMILGNIPPIENTDDELVNKAIDEIKTKKRQIMEDSEREIAALEQDAIEYLVAFKLPRIDHNDCNAEASSSNSI